VTDLFEPIAVVGIAARMPGARDADQFWANLRDTRDCITTLGDDDLVAAGVPVARLADPAYVKAAGLMPGVDEFDAGYFRMSPREAEICDPQLRIMLETTYEVVQDAGYSPETLGRDVAVFAASGPTRYLDVNLLANPKYAGALDMGMSVLNTVDYLATLVSYKFDFRGPSMSVLTACSSSLSAVHLACQSLQLGECDAAVAGGCNVQIPYGVGYRWSPGDVRSADGRCRPFDATASGTIFTSGAAAVLLKRLPDAIVDGDQIRAVIRGIGINNDGSDKVSFSAPSVSGQTNAVIDAMDLAGVKPEGIQFVEMHATGTPLGDPIEVAALAAAYRRLAGPTPAEPILVGSVKSNIGHTVAAAGMAGLLKLVLALEHEQIPATANLGALNPRLELERTPFAVNDTPRPWPRQPGRPRRAGLSSLGVGGTNVHLVVEEGPTLPRTPHLDRPRVVVWSGRDRDAARAARARLAGYFEACDEDTFADAVATLQQGRTPLPVRGALVCRSPREAAALLTGEPAGDPVDVDPEAPPSVVFALPGEAGQHPGTAADLYPAQRVFTETVDVCLDAFAAHGLDLGTVWPRAGQTDPGAVGALADPLSFTIEYALAVQWISWGIQPVALAGRGVGALAAAVAAGTTALPDAVAAVVAGDAKTEHGRPAADPAADLGREVADAVAGATVVLDLGPPAAGSGWARALSARAGRGAAVVCCLGAAEGDDAGSAMLSGLAMLWTMGCPVAWEQVYQDEPLQRVPVPGHPLRRQRYWVAPMPGDTTDAAAGSSPHPATPPPPETSGGPFVLPAWVETTTTPRPSVPPGRCVPCLALLPPDRSEAAALVAVLERAGHQVIGVRAGANFEVRDSGFVVRPSGLAEDLDRVLADLERQRLAPRLLVHAWAVGDGGGTGADGADPLGETFFALFDLVQRAGHRAVTGPPPAVLVLTSASVDVSGAEPVRPERAALLGQVRSLALESPGQRVRLIDLGGGRPGDALLEELLSDSDDVVVALRGNRRWTPAHPTPTTLPPRSSPLRRDGVYVITGGVGGLALAVARGLAATGLAPRLALLTRADRGGGDRAARARAELDALTDAGARVRVLTCDVADRERLEEALDEVTEVFGPVNGVFHLAGVAGGGMMRVRDRAAAEEVLRPKVSGTLALAAALAHRSPVDFVVCFSSRAALTGMFGGADYAAANAFLDAFAAGRPGWLSVDWPAWAQVGMAADGRLDALTGRLAALAATTAGEPAPRPGELHDERVVSASTTWAMDEHRMDGVAVLPGSALVDLVIDGYLRTVPGARAPLTLREVTFVRPVVGDQPRVVRVSFAPRPDRGWQVRVLSRPQDGGTRWQEHAHCAIHPAEPDERVQPIEKLRDGLAEAPPGRPDHESFVFGPRWHNIVRGWESADTRLVEISLPPQYHDEARTHRAHPAILDTGTGNAARASADCVFIPFLYQAMTWYRPLPAHLYSQLRIRHRGEESIVADVRLLDPDGRTAAVIDGFTMRRIRRRDLVPAPGEPAPDAAGAAPPAALRPDEGVRLLLRLLESRTPGQVAVLPGGAGSAPAALPDTPAAPARPDDAAGPYAPAPPAVPAGPAMPGGALDRDRLRDLWCDILGRADIGPDDDFFDLDGDSLAAVALAGRIRDELGVEVGIETVFDHPTLGEMTSFLTSLTGAAHGA
jgi:acyl transferase domain-containing protein/NADP-dependent 3-hydroxy acid dehydrogenase YdfG/acyl carrier protein